MEQYFEEGLSVHGVIAKYVEGVRLVANAVLGRSLVLFFGSSLGNMSKSDEKIFLGEVRSSLKQDDLLILGTDFKKDPSVTLRAYSDSCGVIKSFCMNVLIRMNRELGTDFDVSKFKQYTFYDPADACVKCCLVSTGEQTIHINTETGDRSQRHELKFEEHDAILTVYSRKYTTGYMLNMLESAGFRQEYFDSKGWFADVVAKAV